MKINSKKALFLRIFILFFIFTILCIACGKKSESKDGKKMSDKKVKDELAGVLTNISSDIPIFTKKVKNILYVDDSTKELTIETNETFINIYDFYKESLEKNEWEIIDIAKYDENGSNYLIMECEKDKRKLMITISGDKNKDEFTVFMKIK